jgi:hypothetical protein
LSSYAGFSESKSQKNISFPLFVPGTGSRPAQLDGSEAIPGKDFTLNWDVLSNPRENTRLGDAHNKLKK